MQARDGLPSDAACMMVGAVVDVIFHVECDWKSGRRRVAECVELQGFDPQTEEWIWGESRRPPDAGGRRAALNADQVRQLFDGRRPSGRKRPLGAAKPL